MSIETITCRESTTKSACRDDRPTHRERFFLLSCDEREQDRLNFLHKVFSIARRSDDLIHVPHLVKGRVLDLGCGTGIWAIDVAERYPEMFVVGVDLSPTQPDRHPPNCEFYAPFDFERQWEMGEDSWDVMHLRMGWGSVSNWPSLYRRIFAHLRPGGWFEQVEIDFEPRILTSSSEHLPLGQWYQAFEYATAQTMRPLTHNPPETFGFLQTAGFAEICHQTIQLPLNQWPPDPHQREIGRWYGRAFLQLIEAIDLGSLNRTHGLITQAKLEASDRSIHTFHVLHVYRAQKPPSARSCSSYKCRRHEQTYVER
ncbi:regulator of secondary metabolism LaeA [Aspergillus steynii IBT 23096]|uniref:Velvet complex subunit laeA n=1 Tax=Aspergillus steynii IBT 23096 TaxID=1392250 RepID=A0A2I2G5S7_9EURO|nr:regulator of secondary metabolism LaeA [Aspergillus steynii IBT 23096]PLB48193.1 regulator of secondary metabolism LaeA [Aspergillus steynii IBT 23096]